MSTYLSTWGLTAAPFSKEVERRALAPTVQGASGRRTVRRAGRAHPGTPGRRARRRQDLRPARTSGPAHSRQGAADLLSQRHARPPRFLPAALSRAGTVPERHGRRGLPRGHDPCAGTRARPPVAPVFLLDEAHLLHQDTLDHLHILLNYERDRAALLSLVLVGLPELRDRLQLHRNRSLSLYSRIHARFTIGPTTPEDTADYLHARLTKVGCDREVFASDADAMLHEAAAGSLRDIDRLATASLRETARRKKKLVERDSLARVIDLDRSAGA
jgi:hypothetical protein